jgi:hypothetical protein
MRNEIIKKLSEPFIDTNDYYTQLKSCIICEDVDRVDEWFRGAIESLYYRPNHTALILCGEEEVENEHFLRNLLPGPWYVERKEDQNLVHTNFIINYEFEKRSLYLPQQDEFIVRPSYSGNPCLYPEADKRLASYCSVVDKWPYPPRKNFIVLNVKWIESSLFNSIPKSILWSQIFNHFKPLGK